jgi:hypothetical protein
MKIITQKLTSKQDDETLYVACHLWLQYHETFNSPYTFIESARDLLGSPSKDRSLNKYDRKSSTKAKSD